MYPSKAVLEVMEAMVETVEMVSHAECIWTALQMEKGQTLTEYDP